MDPCESVAGWLEIHDHVRCVNGRRSGCLCRHAHVSTKILIYEILSVLVGLAGFRETNREREAHVQGA